MREQLATKAVTLLSASGCVSLTEGICITMSCLWCHMRCAEQIEQLRAANHT